MLKPIILTATVLATALVAQAHPLPAPPTKAYVAPASDACADQTLNIYFPAGEALMTPHAFSVIEATSEALKGCSVGIAHFEVTSSDARDQASLMKLSERRLAIVANALTSEGVTPFETYMRVETDIDEEAVQRPMTRRVQVHLTAWNAAIG